jgi:predicted alpha/beta-fold hydrolase
MYTFNYYNNSNSTKLTVIIHGASEGINSSFMKKLRNKLEQFGNSFVFIQMPFKDRGESKSSSTELLEEVECVKAVLEKADLANYQQIEFIGKSLGGLILNTFVSRNLDKLENKNLYFTIFGYLQEYYDISQVFKKVNIINGENDKYATSDQIKEKIQGKDNITLEIISKADHSYRDENKLGVFEDIAIELM